MRYPTMAEYARDLDRDPWIGQSLLPMPVTVIDKAEPMGDLWICKICATGRPGGNARCAHSYSAMLEELVGHHLDVAQPFSL